MLAMQTQQRRPHGELREAIREFLAARDEPTTIREIVAGIESKIGTAPSSSYRSALQDERYFERVARGVFKIRKDVLADDK